MAFRLSKVLSSSRSLSEQFRGCSELFLYNLQRNYAPFASETVSEDDALGVKDGKVLHPDLLNANVKATQYAVRGELYQRALQLQKEGLQITYTNVGNPHALGQQPITFNRQVLALCCAPFLLENPTVASQFPSDVVARAKQILGYIPGGVGAYSDSRGSAGIRQEVADFITQRDGVPADPENIFLTDGASVAVRMALNAMIRDSSDGILVPIPQYPLYSASIGLYGGSLIPYFLDEKNNWSLNLQSIQSATLKARSEGKHVRGMVFINPGNPTGNCLSRDNLVELIKFAYENNIVLMADEVYQENIYQDERPFVAARKVMYELGEPYASGLELLSFHTVSKGPYGECGLRGGYYEMTNIHPQTVQEMYKIASINLSPNIIGQVMMALMVNPPKPGDVSYESYMAEKGECLQSLRRRAHMMTDAFNSLEGVTCNFTEGAMYSFPQIRLPAKAMQAAAEMGKAPDVFYCLKLLEATGISTVPGSGFQQEPGTYHLRTTILPMEEKMPAIIEKLRNFHEGFMKQYS
eukprot:TRINITY_DN40527_c0_g1_i1.p1 TRINITY_DN40527_c0_g1~~TRINITY_DN40527_c0_g1_i1.p1  ORF type:complete len:524 (-),score=50.45 TRINITY_DN40527_c0_g1_i1:375-1946(-)